MKLRRAEDLAKKLGIEKETLLEWRELGMPWVKIGKLIYIFEDSFLEWARGHEIRSNGVRDEKDEKNCARQTSISLVSKV